MSLMRPFVCPFPLVQFPLNNNLTDVTIIVAYDNCAIPCPTFDFTTEEWEEWVNILVVLVIISTFFSFLSFASHLFEFNRLYILNMFIGGFFFNSLGVLFWLLKNRDNEMVCAGEGHYAYIEKGTMCIFQAASTIFLFIWVETWSVFLALDTYLHIISGIKARTLANDLKMRRLYTITAVFLSSLAAFIPWYHDVLGFDPKANIPICFFIGGEYDMSDFFWFSFFIPFYTLLILCVCLSIASILRIHQIFIKPQQYLAQFIVSTKENNDEEKNHNSFTSDTNSFSNSPIHNENIIASLERESIDGLHDISDGFEYDEDDDVGYVYDEEDKTYLRSSISKNKNKKIQSSLSSSIIANIWKYNGKSLLFVFIFVVSGIVIGPFIVNIFHTHYTAYIESAEDFATCLVTASIYQPVAVQTQDGVNAWALDQCGSVPSYRPPTGPLYTILAWTSAFGVVPAIVFGFAGNLKKTLLLPFSCLLFFANNNKKNKNNDDNVIRIELK